MDAGKPDARAPNTPAASHEPPIVRLWARWRWPFALALAVLCAILMFALWPLYVVVLSIGVGAGLAVTAWTVYELHYYAKYGLYDIDNGAVSAFARNYAYRAGAPVELYVHSTADATARLFRFGATREDTGIALPIARSIQSNRYSRRDGVDWQVTATLATEGLAPGLYGLEIRQNERPDACFLVPIILTPSAPPPIAVIASTNTWEAYNAFGGVSNYENSLLNPVVRWVYNKMVKPFWIRLPDEVLPRSRPNSALSQDLIGQVNPLAPHHSRLARSEWSLIAFLEREGYDYGLYSSRDFAFSEAPSAARLLVFNGHAEYWTPEMFYRFERYLGAGGRVFISAGNPMFRSTEYLPTGIRIARQDNDREMVSRRIGSYFTHSGYMTAAPFRVELPSHWLFAGTGLAKGAPFGTYSANLPPATLEAGGTASDAAGESGASGIFTNKLGPGSGDFLLLASGLNPVGPAHMLYRDTQQGGWIFNTSSGSFTGALGHDQVVDRIVRSAIEAALAERDVA